MTNLRLELCALYLFGCIAAPITQAAPILRIDQGVLIGAIGVEVNHKLYDVTFQDGTCAQIHGDCTIQNFAFTTFNLASLASRELTRIFDSNGDFDSLLRNTSGCTSKVSCSIMTAFTATNNIARVYKLLNYSEDFADGIGTTPFIPALYNSTDFDDVTWAHWAIQSVNTIPEPSGLPLVSLSLLALIVTRRRNRRSIWNFSNILRPPAR